MRSAASILLAGVLSAAGACTRSPAVAPADAASRAASGEVEASFGAAGVTLVNGTDRGIAYAVWNPNFLGLMAVCAEPDARCVRLAAGQRVVVPAGEFNGWTPSPGTEAQPGLRALEVRWWHVVPDGAGGFAATDVRVIPLVP